MDEEYNKRRPIPRPPSDSSRGMLRSKIECGMGTVPLSTKVHLQTWDGVMSGDRLLTMACSDKILRWNIVGKITFLSFSTDLHGYLSFSRKWPSYHTVIFIVGKKLSSAFNTKLKKNTFSETWISYYFIKTWHEKSIKRFCFMRNFSFCLFFFFPRNSIFL